MNNNETLTENMVELLRQKARNIESDIEILTEDLKAIHRTIAKFSINGQLDMLLESVLRKDNERMGPTEAVRKIIYSHPDKKWKPKEISFQFQAMYDYGSIEMKSDAKAPIPTLVHGILGRLRKKGDVERKGIKGNHWYRKPIVEESLVN